MGTTTRTKGAVSIGLVMSAGFHVAIVVAAMAISRHAPAQQAPGDELIDIDLGPPKGVVEGHIGAVGTPPREISHPRTAARTATAPRDDIPDTSDEDAFFKRAKRRHDKEDPPEKKDDKKDDKLTDQEREELRKQVERAMLAPKSAPEGPVTGPGDAQPKGTPEGAGAGKKGGLGSSYKSMLGSWFSSRWSLRGSTLSWEELKLLTAGATITISPDSRTVTGATMTAPTGNAAFDASVNAALKGAIGAKLPEPPDGADVPSSISLRFHCRDKNQCS